MVSKFTYVFYALCLLSVAFACSKAEDGDRGKELIVFGVQDFDVQVKGSELTTDNINSFGVYAALEDGDEGFDDVSINLLQPFMTDIPVSLEDGLWTASPSHYWPILQDKHISFFAYAPHSSGTGISAKAGWEEDSGVSGSKTVEITYTLDSNPAKHVDLCVASAVLDRAYDVNDDGEPDPVYFNFSHTLASVSFAANYIGELPKGCYLRIDELVVSSFLNSNTLVYESGNQDFFAWKEVAAATVRDGRYVMNIGGGTLSSNQPLNLISSDPLEEVVYTDFVTSNGLIYVIPQEINPAGSDVSSKIDVTFSYVKSSSDAIIAQFYTSIDLPASTLEVARKYKYQFTLDVTTASLISISCVDAGAWITDWKNSNNSHSDTMIK